MASPQRGPVGVEDVHCGAFPRVASRVAGQPWVRLFRRGDNRFLSERYSFSPQIGRRSIVRRHSWRRFVAAEAAWSGLLQGFLHAQLVMNNSSEGFHSLGWVSGTPDVSADG